MSQRCSRASKSVALALSTGPTLAQAFIGSPATNHATSASQSVGLERPALVVGPSTESRFAASGSSAAWAGVTVAAGVAATRHITSQKRVPNISRKFFGESTTTPVKFEPSQQLGVQEPVGFWDPLGLSADKDETTFKRRRAVEIKHGRIAMYATMGYIIPYYYKFDGYLSPSMGVKFADVPNGLAALSKVPLLGWCQIVFFIGLIENTGFFSGRVQSIGIMKDPTMDGTPGDYGVGFPTFLGKVEDPEAKATKLAAELANGRLAMMAIIGMFFQDGLTGSAWGDWALYEASPLRATEAPGAAAEAEAAPAPPPFEPSQQVGVTAPLGFFDPAGFSKTGDATGFRSLRAAEIKHGRVAMMAALGAVVQHYVQFPGFEIMPTGLEAVITPPGIYGFVVLFALAGFMELNVWAEDPSKEPGNFGDPLGLGQYNEDMRNKEINNGRVAMFAALGIVAADLYTGLDGIDQLGLDGLEG